MYARLLRRKSLDASVDPAGDRAAWLGAGGERGRGSASPRREVARTGDDASHACATIATSTGGVTAWMSAVVDPTRWVMFPGRRGGGATYDASGTALAGAARDPLDEKVTYRKTLVALEVVERRGMFSCGVGTALGDGRSKEGMRTCALRIMRSRETTSGDERCAGEFFVVYLHGNACDIGDCADEAMKLAIGLKSHVIVPEYPGYGATEGVAHEESVNAIAKATVKYCVRYLLASQSRIIIVGRSIGTGPAAWLTRLMCAQDGIPAGLVLQSPFTSIRDLAKRYVGVASYAIPDRWNTMQNLAEVDCPVLILHGTEDRVIPFSHSESIIAHLQTLNAERSRVSARPHSVTLFEQDGRDHNDYNPETDVVVPIMKWIRRRVKPYVFDRDKRQHKVEDDDSRFLKPMYCRLVADPIMLKQRQLTHRAPPSSAI